MMSALRTPLGASTSRPSQARKLAPQVTRRSTVSVSALGKQDVADHLAKELGLTKTRANETLNVLLDLIRDEVTKGNEVSMPGFGSFKRVERLARDGRNPSTGEPLKIPAKLAPAFSFGKTFKDQVAGLPTKEKKVAAPKALKEPKVKVPKEPKSPAAAKPKAAAKAESSKK